VNRHELFHAMINRQTVTLNRYTGKILAIELEDGSGYCFNVKLVDFHGQTFTIFVRSPK